MKRLIVLLGMVAVSACGGEDATEKQPEEARPISQSKNSSTFNQSFAGLLNSYYQLKDALVLSNDTMAVTYAKTLSAQADSLQLKELKTDSSLIEMAEGYLHSVSAEAKGLQGEKDIEGKRKSFQMISDNLYDLVRTVRYDQETIYHQYCPMAFNDAGAYWLSKSDEIKNPYFGKKMLTCGEVKDSLKFGEQ